MKTLVMIAISTLLISCIEIQQAKSTNITNPGDLIFKRLTNPCFDLGAVRTSDFFTSTVLPEISSLSVLKEVGSLPIPTQDIMEGLAVGRYAIDYELYSFNETGNCVYFRSTSLVNIDGQLQQAVSFDSVKGNAIKEIKKTSDGNTVARYDLTNPTFTPATDTPEFGNLGIDPRVFEHIKFSQGQTFWKISVNVPNQAKNKAELGFAYYDPKFVFFQVVDKPTDFQSMDFKDLLFKFSPENLKSLGKKFWIQVFGNK